MSGEPWRARCGSGVSGIGRHRGGKGKSRQDYEGHLKSLFQGQWGYHKYFKYTYRRFIRYPMI